MIYTGWLYGDDVMDRMDVKMEMLFSLLRAGLWERPEAVMQCRPLSETSWEEVLSLAEKQTVTGVAYLGIRFMPEGLEPPVNVLAKWAAKADAIERRNVKMSKALDELCSMFRENGISPVLQKGHDAASLYEHPMLRECGDIDFYFMTSEEKSAASALAARHGCRIRTASDGSDCYSWNGIPVEHHSRLLDLYSPFRKGLAEKLEAEYGFEERVLESGDGLGTPVKVPAPMLKLLMLNLHILKHVVGRGIGLRQICDMARACFRLHDRIDMQEAESVARRAGIRKWNRLLHSFMVTCLGLDSSCLPYKDMDASKTDALLQRIMDGGNFGRSSHGGMLSGETAAWSRKLNTAAAFLLNSGFSMSVAPEETLSVFFELLSGQKRCAD